jgi:hypothetical protein
MTYYTAFLKVFFGECEILLIFIVNIGRGTCDAESPVT